MDPRVRDVVEIGVWVVAILLGLGIAMLEWAGSRFEVSPGNRHEIRLDDVAQALSVAGCERPFTDKDLYIRECFGALGDALELVEHDLRTGLIEFRDVEFPMAHTVVLRKHWAAIFGFTQRSGYDLALVLVKRFPKAAP